ncbi:MAG: alpha/beta fold hydrolase [Nitrospira sp.]|nr:alpha/beta fold hydrolase [Nitrospira sp.]MCW5787296.1 alpha/beta fold hydrolase [Nitrospira sp.]
MLVVRMVLALGLAGLVGCAGATPPVRTNSGAHPPQLSDVIPPDQPFTRHLVNVDGLRLSVLEAGTGDPIIFVHGVVTTSNIFPKYVGAYAPDFRGIAVDLRGYGDSEKPATGFTIERFARDLIGLADALEIEKAVWVGVSMGGMILQQLALDHPERVRALVLVSTTDGAMILDQDIPTIGHARDYREVSKRMIVESFPAGTLPKTYQPLLERIPTWNGTVIREALTSMSQFHVHGRLSAIAVPTLIMVGAKDDVATPAIAMGIQGQIPGAQLVEFNTGHFMMAEDPDRFRIVLGDFLARLPR